MTTSDRSAHLARRPRFGRAFLHEVFDGFSVLVRHHDELVALLGQVLGHAVSHHPDADESDLLCHD
jgi:hypothetical protein